MAAITLCAFVDSGFYLVGCKYPHGLGLAGALEWVVAPRFLLGLACVFYKE